MNFTKEQLTVIRDALLVARGVWLDEARKVRERSRGYLGKYAAQHLEERAAVAAHLADVIGGAP